MMLAFLASIGAIILIVWLALALDAVDIRREAKRDRRRRD